MSVSSLLYDKKGKLWIGTVGKGVYQYAPDMNESIKIEPVHEGEDELFRGVVSSIEEDRYRNIWIGSGSGLIKYNHSTKKYSH